jgi:hypothetical protein
MSNLAQAFADFAKLFEPSQPKVQAILTDQINGGTGSAAVADRPGWVWALVGGAITQVLAPDIMPVAGLPVNMQMDPNTGMYQMTGVNYAAIQDYDGSSFFRQHGPQHNINGGDPTYIDQRQILIGLLRQQATADMTVIAGPVYYTYNGATVLFDQANTSSLSGYLPTTAGYSRWILISINPATNALQYTAGSEFLLAYADPGDYFPSIPNAAIVLGDIRLEIGTTTVTQDMIDGRRRAFLQSSSSAGSLTSRVLATGNELIIPDTYCLIVADYFTLQGTATLTLQGDAELRIL